MRAATFLALLAVGVIGVSTTTIGAERATTFSFRAPVVAPRHAEPRDLKAKHQFVRPKQHRLKSPALFPFDTWYDGTTAMPPPPVPTAPAEVAEPASTPPEQLPACQETVEGVTIMRGRPCHA